MGFPWGLALNLPPRWLRGGGVAFSAACWNSCGGIGRKCAIYNGIAGSPEHIPLILLGENAEVQISSNFVAHGFQIFGILAALSGKDRENT